MKQIELTKWVLPTAAAVAVLATAVLQPRFLSFENIGNVLSQSIPLEIFAIAQMLPLLIRGLDLSQGGTVVLTSVSFALMAQRMGTGVAAVLVLLIGCAAGLTNGLVISRLKVSSLVVTLGTGSVLSGIALIASNGQPISDVPVSFSTIFGARLWLLPFPLVVVVVVFIAVWFFLSKVLYGRYLYAVGSNERAAMLSGIPVSLTTIGTYVGSGVLTSVGAILLSSRISSGHPTVGSDTALRAIAAAVIGGVSLFGGRGTVFGVFVGGLFLGLLANALNLINVSSFVQQIAIGFSIIVAAALDRWRFMQAN